MKTILTFLLLFISLTVFSQDYLKERTNLLREPIIFKVDQPSLMLTQNSEGLYTWVDLHLPDTKSYKLVNSKSWFWIGQSCLFISGFFQNWHTIYVTEPQYCIDKFGWKDHRDNQNNASNGTNSFFSPFKNPDHGLQALTTFFAAAGVTSLYINYSFDGGKVSLKGNNTWEKIFYIAAPLVLGRVSMGAGGQLSNYWIKNEFDPL